MGSTLARGLKEFITHKFSSLRPEDAVELYYSKRHEKSHLAPILRVIVHGVDRTGRPDRSTGQRYITGLIYRDHVPETRVFNTRVPMHDINRVMRGIQGAQAAFRRAAKIGPLARLELIGDPGTMRSDLFPPRRRAAPKNLLRRSDAPEFRRFLAWRVKRELKRRAIVTAAGAALRRHFTQNVTELILRKIF